MDKEKAKLIFEKIKEIKEIVETEPNNEYCNLFFLGDYMGFNNDPEKKENYYSFSLHNGKIERLR